jgi:hypothetical protein
MKPIDVALCGAVLLASHLVCAQQAPPGDATARPAAAHAATTIRITSGTYGENCGARPGNITSDLSSRCDGERTCGYVFTGARGSEFASVCRGDLAAEWQCGNSESHSAMLRSVSGTGDRLVLSCLPEAGPGR